MKKRWILLSAIPLVYLSLLGLLVYVESASPEATIRNLPQALWYSLVTVTTVGYGDLYPISNTGRVISILSSIVGIAIIALPSGIITAGYMDELKLRKELKEREETAPLASAE